MANSPTKLVEAAAVEPTPATSGSPELTRNQKAMTVVNSYVPWSLGAGLVPLVGPVASIAAMPGMYSAATYATERIFVTHFEASGTFLDFDPRKTRAHFISEFKTARAPSEPQKAA